MSWPKRPDRPDGFDQWTPATFEIATQLGVDCAKGWTLNGIGLHLNSAIKARYVRKDGTRRVWSTWTTTHLNSGHAVRHIKDQPIARVFELATELAVITDWDAFSSLTGWQNTDPDVPDKLQSWHRRNALVAVRGSGMHHDQQAVAIASARA